VVEMFLSDHSNSRTESMTCRPSVFNP